MTLTLMVLGLYISFINHIEVRLGVFGLNSIFIIIFYLVIAYTYNKKADESYWSIKRLSLFIFSISLIGLTLLNAFYYYTTGDFYEFSAIDTFEYDKNAKWLINYGLFESVGVYFKSQNEYSDFAANYITSLAYRIYPSTIVFNIFNIIAGCLTTISIYRISSYYLDNKYSFIASLSFGLSSFTIYLYSTGMKESFFALFVVLFYDCLISFRYRRNLLYLYLSVVFVIVIYFFRPAVMFMMLLSVLMGIFFSVNKSKFSFILMVPLVAVLYYYVNEIFLLKEVYLTSSEIIEYRSGLLPNSFNYLAASLSGALGPFPTYIPRVDGEQQAFYSIGLGFRVLISVFFWLGLKDAIMEKNNTVLMMYSFVLLDMLSLAIILESFELRLNSPHLPLVYILSFIYFVKLKENKRGILENNLLLYLFVTILITLIVIWQFRL